MSLVNLMAALEDFEDEVSSAITTEPPTDGAFDQETAGVNFQEESDDVDSDIDSITTSAKGLEDIISLVNEAPGEDDKPIEPFVQKAVNVALESNDMVAAAGKVGGDLAPSAGSGDTKKGVLDKVKDFAAKVWEMLRNFGKRIAGWVREMWAKYTDRIVKNSNQAKKIIEEMKTLATRNGAKITDKGLLAKVSTFKNGEIGEVILAVSEYAAAQAGKDSETATKEARTCIDLVSAGSSNAEGVMERFVKALASAGGSYSEEASLQQAQAIKSNGAGTKTLLSKPFFSGYRAWITVPENADALQYWNHGITKIDEVKAQESIDAPDAQEIKAIAEYIVGMGALVTTYQNNIKQRRKPRRQNPNRNNSSRCKQWCHVLSKAHKLLLTLTLFQRRLPLCSIAWLLSLRTKLILMLSLLSTKLKTLLALLQTKQKTLSVATRLTNRVRRAKRLTLARL